jgi:threonine dehydratase
MIRVPELEADAIRAVHSEIDPAFTGSPQYVHPGLSARLGAPVIVKVETDNPIRSFKGRGTWVAVHRLAGQGRIGPARPIVVASAGNFGQGIPYAARDVGVSTVVFASMHANPGKVARMRTLGATVHQVGQDFDAAVTAARSYVAEHGGEFLVDGEDPSISAGAATMALEVTDAVEAGVLPAVAAAFVPVGNGALINGVGSWLQAVAPGCAVVGVQAEGAPAMTLSWRAGRAIDTPSVSTYADGIAARVSIPQAVELMAGRVDEMLLIPEAALHEAQAELTSELGITVEGAAAASWAAALRRPVEGGAALLIVTGSNV